MTFNAVGSGTSLSAYVSTLLNKTAANGSGTASTSTTTPISAASQAAAKAALAAASQSIKSTTAQQQLQQKGAALAKDLQSAVARSGVALSATPVEFSVQSNGSPSIDGNAQDKAAVAAALKADKSNPSLSARLTALAKDADTLSGSIRQSAAIFQAAKYGAASSVVSLYSSLMKQQDTTPAVFSVTSSTSSLTYPGGLASKA